MNRVNQINRLLSGGLTWGSLVLLMGFLIYWNVDNYGRKKADLVKDLEYEAKLASSAVNDSILFAIVQVMNTDSNYTQTTRTIKKLTSGVRLKIDGDFRIENPDSMMITLLDETMGMAGHLHDTIEAFYFIGQDTTNLLQDMAHRVNTGDSLIEVHTTGEWQGVDVIGEFKENLLASRLPAEFVLTSQIEGPRSGDIAIDFEFDPMHKVNEAAIFRNYRGYLFKKILPTLLASIVVFGSICLAFVVMRRALDKQRKVNQMKSEFVSNMTHELKTPITTVGVALEALSDFGVLRDKSRTEEYIDISKQEVNRLNMLVDKVLQVSMFEKGEAAFKIEPIDLRQILTGILATMKLHFERKNATVELEMSGNEFTTMGDRVHLTNVCYNLIDNAIKYGGDKPELKINLEEEADSTKLIFADRGIGIPAAFLNRIFDRFFRVPTDDVHNVKGHGLGLSYVAHVIRKHQGNISAQSAIGQGTTFSISLPKMSRNG